MSTRDCESSHFLSQEQERSHFFALRAVIAVQPPKIGGCSVALFLLHFVIVDDKEKARREVGDEKCHCKETLDGIINTPYIIKSSPTSRASCLSMTRESPVIHTQSRKFVWP